ncbi:MAG: hypothetical protein HYV09_13665 [Deltaproteobacteria bacterium]|nr:hypothetical protein [Deltaproteobacteria bacterium]
MRAFAGTILFVVVALLGCQQEKSKAEKHAEQLAAEKASASAAAQASAAVVDPKEEQYKAKRKALKDRATAHMAALEKLYVTGSEADRTAFREFFPPTKEGEKEADDTSKEALVAAKNTKMSIKKWEIQDLNFDAAQTTGTTDISVEEQQAGANRCVVYKLDWKELSGSFRRVARRDFRIVPCG